jgi:hypothetical protein
VLLRQLLSLVPATGVIGVEGQHRHGGDSRGDRAATPTVLDDAPQGWSTVTDPVDVERRDGNLNDPGGVSRLVEPCRKGLHLGHYRRWRARGVS